MPREGHDPKGFVVVSPASWISIHVPREGHDDIINRPHQTQLGFQSTCPARGTTANATERKCFDYISIHVPREGHDICSMRKSAKIAKFQSTCPARGTTDCRFVNVASFAFQSTCPARGTTIERPHQTQLRHISIHVPREGHDASSLVGAITP